MNLYRPLSASRMHPREKGFSLVELMIGSAIGLIILAALSYVLVSNVQSRTELERGSRQMESGRFSLATLVEEIQLAGFYGEYFPASVGMTTPDPCANKLNEMGFADANYRWNTTAPVVTQVPAGLFGFAETVAASANCAPYLTTRKAGTDVLVVRRASTETIAIDTNEDSAADANVTLEDGSTDTYASLGKGYYLQASNCSEIGAATEFAFVMDKDTSRFLLHKGIQKGTPASCTTGILNGLRKYIVRIFYISTCNDCSGTGDGIPTLKMRELSPAATICDADPAVACGTFTERAIADGIENLQIEYGIDSTLDGVPDTFVAAPAATDWQNAVAVKVFLLARNIEQSTGYVNTKTYALSSDGSVVFTAPSDKYRRHLYSATAKANNLAGRRP